MKKTLSYSEGENVIGVHINPEGSLIYCTGRIFKITSLQTILKGADGKEKKFLHEQIFTGLEILEAIAYHEKLHDEMSKK